MTKEVLDKAIEIKKEINDIDSALTTMKAYDEHESGSRSIFSLAKHRELYDLKLDEECTILVLNVIRKYLIKRKQLLESEFEKL